MHPSRANKAMPASLIDWTLNTIDSHTNAFIPPADMRYKIASINSLPPLPGIAQRILILGADPLADAAKLAALVEQDPLLTAQIIRWASSPYYGYRGKIVSVYDAISRVLGFDMVFNLALGLAALAPLKTPKSGPIGTKTFWCHALASAEVMKMLNNKVPSDLRVSEQHVFLAALLHNLGFPLLGDQFPEEFHYLNTLITTNASLNIVNLENFALGVNHAMLGAWLMTTWSMPKALINVVYHHHNPHYRGEFYELNLLTFLSDCILGKVGLGDGCHQVCPDEVVDILQIQPAVVDSLAGKLGEKIEKINIAAEMFIDN